MVDEQSEQLQGEPKEDESQDRLEDIEYRLASLEEGLRLNTIEERLNDLEGVHENVSGGPAQKPEGEGQRAAFLALAGFLNNETVVKAATDLTKTLGETVKEWSTVKTKEIETQKKISLVTYYVGLLFSAFVLAVLSALVWNDKIGKELAAGLFGSLIGYWYGREKTKG